MIDDEKPVLNQNDARDTMDERKEHVHPLAAAESERESERADESLLNAALIIERFGGIRPMATKTNIAATTIQGWKQRGVIPNARRQEIMEAAQLYEIDIEDVLDGVKEGDVSPDAGVAAHPAIAQETIHENESAPDQAQPQPKMPPEKPSKQDEFTPKKSRYQTAEFGPGAQASIEQIHDHNRKQFERMNGQSNGAIWFAVSLIFLCVLGVAAHVFLSPKVKNIDVQQQKIAELEQEVEKLRVQNSRVLLQRQEGASHDENGGMRAGLDSTLSELQSKVGALSDQAKNYAQTIEEFKNGSVNERLQNVEQSLQGLADHTRALGLQGFLYRLQNLQSSEQGQEIVAQWMSSIAGGTLGAGDTQAGGQAGGQGGGQAANESSSSFETALTQLRMNDPQFAETFRDVAPEDVKAAIMLMAMAQLRNSLDRDRASFDQDLTILKMTVGKDNPELAKSIDLLAPKAKSGVLTPEGLSKEFRAMSGEIIADSLAGKDVSVKDKAIARLSDLVKVEKNGAQISGTRAQIKVAEAQKLLDQGDIAGAMAILQETQNEQAGAQAGGELGQNDRINAFLSEAEATLAAKNLQQTLQNKVSLQLKSLITSARMGAKASGGGSGAAGEYMVKPGLFGGGGNP